MTGFARARAALRAAVLPLVSAAVFLWGCTAEKQVVYATPDYRSWKRTTDVVLDYPIPGHQDSFRVPRMNGVGFGAKPTVVNGKRRWDFPTGTIIVKEVYRSMKPAQGEQPIQLTIMVKAPGDVHSQGGWIWLTRNLPDGREAAFMGNFCITCHADANEKHPFGDGNPNEEFRDYVFFIPADEAPGPGPAGGY